MKKKGLWGIITLLLLLAALSCTAGATPVSSNGKLSVKGTKIVNAKGQTFQIKGVSTHGLAWFPEYVSYAAFKDLRDNWGANTVRLAMYTAEYGGYRSGGSKSALKAKVNEGVKAATDLGLYVIIDWHVLNDSGAFTDKKFKEDAVSFFTEMAKKYKNYNNVIYEICNEPNGGNSGSWKNIKSYANTVIAAIRKIDKDAIIIVGTPTWSQDVDEAAKSPLSYSNLVYALHFYAGTHKESYRQKAEKAIKAGLPLLVSEFGISDASGNGSLNTSEGDKWITFLNKHGIGYVAWNLSNKGESSALLKSSTKKASGWKWSDLSKSGQWLVKKYGGKLAKSAAVTTSKKTSSKTTAAKKKTTTKKKTTKKKTTKKKTTAKKKKAAKSSKSVTASAKYAKASVKAVNSWYDGQRYYTQYQLTIKNTSKKKITNWKVKVNFRDAIKKNQQWCGKYAFSSKYITIRPVSYNKKIAAKKSVNNVGFIVSSASGGNKVTSVKFVK